MSSITPQFATNIHPSTFSYRNSLITGKQLTGFLLLPCIQFTLAKAGRVSYFFDMFRDKSKKQFWKNSPVPPTIPCLVGTCTIDVRCKFQFLKISHSSTYLLLHIQVFIQELLKTSILQNESGIKQCPY